MLKVDKAILVTSETICKNIDRFDSSERGLLSQNILAQLRNLVEYIAQKIYSNGNDIDPNEYQHKKESWEYIQSQGNLKFLYDFHGLLQKSVSHYTIDENGSERLMLKYYEYLLKIKIFLKNAYNLEVLINIDQFPLNLDKSLTEYYERIANRILNNSHNKENLYKDKYYIQKIKPFFVYNSIYYEITFTLADDKTSKFDGIIAFTKYEILSNYSVQLHIREDFIEIFNTKMPIKVIDNWRVSIRNCELKNFSKIFNMQPISGGSQEYYNLMNELTKRKMSFIDIINLSDRYYNEFRNLIINNSNTQHFINILDYCRTLIKNNKSGANIIRYLLLKLNNKIIKKQYSDKGKCNLLSDLRLNYGCIPFEQMPFCTSLIGHNPKISDLFDCISSNNREHEFLARLIKNNTEQNEMIFTPISEVTGFNNVMALVDTYNNKLYKTHKQSRSISVYKDHLYINEYVDNCIDIIRKIEDLTSSGVNNYKNYVNDWLQDNNIDCDEKKKLLKNMFCDSKVSLIYGAAGTGKSTLINHISNLWGSHKKLYLANTNPAVNNLKRRVNSANCEFMTIAKFLSKINIETYYDLLFIDECSTVSNKDMRRILEKAYFQLLILVGDVYQIESISFGNWFSIIKNFIKKSSILELTKPYRTNNKNLLTVWDRVRNMDIAILEPMVKNDYSVYLDNSILNAPNPDEIILCLNYDGIYGINNINRFLQSSNPNKVVSWGINTYKVGDPVLFNESDRFSPLIYNNLKGKIIDIEIKPEEKKIFFSIEISMVITEVDANIYDFELLKSNHSNKSIIKFYVNQYQGVDEDDEHTDSLVPFQVTYALSIHKAQGLEYDSVKIVITNEVEELINHSIFYTAITRTKNQLKIYWTPETEKKVLNSFTAKNLGRDIGLLKSFIKEQ